MESEDDILYDDDSGNDAEEDEEDEFVDFEIAPEPTTTQHQAEKNDMEDFPFEVLTADQIVKHMVDCIREVNAVVQVHDKCLCLC